MKKNEKKITPLSEFPTEVIVFYFKKFRKCRHYEYEKPVYDSDGCLVDEDFIIEDVTEEPFEGRRTDDTMYIQFDGMYWSGKRSEFMEEMNRRGNVDISAKNFKDWKREYKKRNKR